MKLLGKATLIVGSLLVSLSHAESITVLAAASLQNAIDEIGASYQKQHEVKITSAYDSSSNLARQIEQGAPADIFISANQAWMDYLEEKNKIDTQTRKNIVKNELAVITYLGNSNTYAIEFDSKEFWEKALTGTKLAVGDPDHVPVGMYTKEAFTKLGVWDVISPKVAAAQNVRAALFLVEQKEAELGVVYSSDAKISQKVTVIATISDNLHEPIDYPIAIIPKKRNKNVDDFYDYLLSDEAKTIFEKYGFTTP